MQINNSINLDNEQSALAKVIWRNALHKVKDELSHVLFVTWIEPLVPFFVDENTLWLCAPDEISFRYLHNYVPLFENAIAATNAFRLEVKLVIGQEQMRSVLREQLSDAAYAYANYAAEVAQTAEVNDNGIPAEKYASTNEGTGNIGSEDSFFSHESEHKPEHEFSTKSFDGHFSGDISANTVNRLQTDNIVSYPSYNSEAASYNSGGNPEFFAANTATATMPSPSSPVLSTPLPVSTAVNNYYQVRFNPEYTFGSFVVGPNNTMAHAACVAIADSYSKQNSVKPYNPLFLYGGSGLGKTHLLNAIGNRVLEHNPHAKILYVQTEDFVNEFISTIKKQNYNVFRAKYRNCDLLLIDDIQFIEGKEQMQEEFFYTFNKLYELNSSIVMTCDKHPRYLVTLEERLRTRFLSGLACDINPPNYETRVAILLSRAQALHEDIDIEIISYIAKNISVNIRELEGALNSVLAIKHLSGHINLALAQKALEPVIKQSEKKSLTPDFIADIVATYYNIAKSQLYSETRQNKVTYPRHVAMYLCRELLDMTYSAISQAFNRSDHTTTRNACLKIEHNLQSDLKLQKEIAGIKKSLHES